MNDILIHASSNTAFPQLCQYACGWDAAGIPERSTTYRAKAAPSMARTKEF